MGGDVTTRPPPGSLLIEPNPAGGWEIRGHDFVTWATTPAVLAEKVAEWAKQEERRLLSEARAYLAAQRGHVVDEPGERWSPPRDPTLTPLEEIVARWPSP